MSSAVQRYRSALDLNLFLSYVFYQNESVVVMHQSNSGLRRWRAMLNSNIVMAFFCVTEI